MLKRLFSVAVALFLLVGCSSNAATTASSVTQSSTITDSVSSEEVMEEVDEVEEEVPEPEYGFKKHDTPYRFK